MERGERALFIGGSRGIGRELAVEAMRRRVRPIVVSRNFHDDPEMAAARRLVADVSTPEGIGSVLREYVWDVDHVFWIAGAYRRARLADTEDVDIDRALAMHQSAMVRFVRDFHRARFAWRGDAQPPRAYTLTVIGSVSSYRIRRDEAVYAMAKAGQAAFLRNYAAEMAEDLPGSGILLVNCARLADRPGERKTDTGGQRISPGFVAKFVWDIIAWSTGQAFNEINVERGDDGPVVSYGPKAPAIVL